MEQVWKGEEDERVVISMSAHRDYILHNVKAYRYAPKEKILYAEEEVDGKGFSPVPLRSHTYYYLGDESVGITFTFFKKKNTEGA